MINNELNATLLGGGDSLIFKDGKIISMGYNPGKIVGVVTYESDKEIVFNILKTLQGRNVKLDIKIMKLLNELITFL